VVEFATPGWLFLLPAPLVWWLTSHVLARRERNQSALLHPLARLLGELQREERGREVPWLWLIGCMLIVVAMARPQWLGRGTEDEPRRNIVFAVDISGSMRALDYEIDGRRISRLDMVKRALKRFLERAEDLRVGLVVFADDALSFMPLTRDLKLASDLVDEIDHGFAGERTALGDAIALSVKRMQAVEGRDASRALIVMSDGIDTSGAVSPEAAAELAREARVRIYTVGVGTAGRVPFPLTSADDLTYTELPLDEASLQNLAAKTGGTYFHILRTEDMDRVLARIDDIEKTQGPAPARGEEWYWLPAVAGLLALILAELRRRRRVAPA
jgi:Ca-activated chloride channel family protein